ncbi:hypothetical protein HID58_052248, partial [Brassica napus]
AQGPPTIPNDPEGTPPSRGQTLRLRRRPPSKRHRVKPTVDSPEGTGNYSLNTITTANAFHSGTGVDRAEEASASRRTNPRNLTASHHDRALTPETDLPWTSLFQSSGKAVGREDETKVEINNFTGG